MGAVLQQLFNGIGHFLSHRVRTRYGKLSRALESGVARIALFAFAIGLALVLHTGNAAADSNARVEAREESGYGRIILDFDSLPPYRHELDSGVLVLWFEDSVKADLREVPQDLPNYVGLARRDPDGRALRIALNRTFRINLMEAGDQLYVDILPPEWKGAPPPLPPHVIKMLSRKATERERKAKEEERQREATKFPYKLDIRLARNPTFSRIVFDWNKFVTVNLSRQGSNAHIEFGAQADAHLAALKTDPPKYLKGVELKKTGHKMEVVLSVDDDVDVRGFREGFTYVVDLTGPDVSPGVSADKTAEMLGLRPSSQDSTVPETAKDVTVMSAETAADDAATAAEKPDQQVDIQTEDLSSDDIVAAERGDTVEAPDAPAEQTPAVQTVEAAPLPDRRPARDTGVQPAPSVAAAPPAAQQTAPAPAAEPAVLPPPAAAIAQPVAEARNPEQTAVPAAAPSSEPVPETGATAVQVESAGPNLRLTFPFASPVSAAVFRRARTIWLVFDSTQPLDLKALKAAQGDKLTGVRHIRSGSMQYLRLQLSRAWLTYVSSHDSAWIVDIGDLVSGHSEAVKLQRKLRDDKRSVIGISLKNPGRVHWLADPEIGDRLAVVTAFAPQRSVAKPQDFVEFTAIATAHGLAFQINSDDVAVRLKLDEVIITRRSGLTLSAGDVHQYVPGRKPLARKGRMGFLEVQVWEVKDPSKLSQRIHSFQRAIALAEDDQRNDRRFDLAQLYFANGFTREALGVLKRMAGIDPALVNDPSFNALRGGVLTLLSRNKEARKDFEVHALANDQDAALWLGLLDAAEENWESALQNFEEGADAIGSYRSDLQVRFRLAAARSALELKKLSRAADELDALPEPIADKALKAGSLLLRGWYLQSIGRADEALEAYNAVLKGDQRPVIAEAELRMIGLLLAEGKIKPAEALAGLERLLIIWRGDSVELGAMRLLANLYIQESRYRDAFKLMKNGLQAFPNSSVAALIQDDMKLVFRNLYLNGGKEKLAPIDSLALYYDFRELMPVGRQGDEMIRRLADDLIEFDLLDQAAELLNHQVLHRLNGAARSQVATRLAMVHLMNHKPDLALRAIRQTRQAGLAGELRRSRSLLEARALGELGRAEAAIEILNTLEGEDVERLKTDALWSAQKWLKAGQGLEKMLGGRWQEGAALSDAERFDVLRSAIAYALAGDQFSLDRVRKKFYEKMVKTRDAESFVIVTKPVKSQGVSFRELARDVAAIDTLDAFMKAFRARYDGKSKPAKTSANPDRQGAG